MYLWITHLFVCIYVHLCLHIRHSISITYFSLSSHVAPVVKNQSANPLEEDVWQPTPVFLPGKFQGQRSLTGYSSLGCKRLDSGAMHICTHFSKITKKMEWPDSLPTVILIYHFSALSSLNKYNRKCQEARVRTGHGKTDWFHVGKGVHQSCILSPCLFNLYAEYIMGNARLDEAQAGIKITGRNINNLKYADDSTLMAESEEKLKSPLMKVEEESEKVGLKFNIQKIKTMSCGLITSRQIDGETMETVQFSSVTQSYPTVCNPMDCSMPGFPVHHQLPEFAQTCVHWVSDVIQPSHPLSSPSPSTFNLSQHQGLFLWVSCLHHVAKVLEFQLQHQSFQWIFRTDFV